jgi:hypothetical protein
LIVFLFCGKGGIRMDICPKCDSLLRVGKNYYSTENDETPDLPTKIFINLEMICLNVDCSNYAGVDIENPNVIVESIKNSVN